MTKPNLQIGDERSAPVRFSKTRLLT